MRSTILAGTSRMGNTLTDVGGIVSGVAAIVASVGHYLSGLFGRSAWAKRPQDVADWFHYHGEQAFQDWMMANHPDGFGSLDTVLALYPLWVWSNGQFIRKDTVDPAKWKWGVTDKAYAALGLDYEASFANYMKNRESNAQPMLAKFAVLLPGQAPNALPPGAAAVVQGIVDKVDAGQPLTPRENAIGAGIAATTDPDGNVNPPDDNTALKVGGALLALYILSKH